MSVVIVWFGRKNFDLVNSFINFVLNNFYFRRANSDLGHNNIETQSTDDGELDENFELDQVNQIQVN